jgi:hypothetical protein
MRYNDGTGNVGNPTLPEAADEGPTPIEALSTLKLAEFLAIGALWRSGEPVALYDDRETLGCARPG